MHLWHRRNTHVITDYIDCCCISIWLQEEEDWHARCHQLRHFKQVHHHLNLPAAPDTGTAATAGLDAVAADGSSSSSAQWEGLAEWLQQQRQLMAASDKLAVHLQQCEPAGPATSTKLSKLQLRMLQSLGV
jgi:hypothetical protein